MKIQPRLAIYFALLVSALIVIRSIITYVAIYNYNQKVFYNRLHEKALTAADLLLNVGQIDSALLKVIDRSQYDRLPDENISIYDSTNKQLYSNNDTLYFTTTPELFTEIKEKKYLRYTDGPYKIIGIYYANSKSKAIITAGARDTEGEALLLQVRNILLLTLFGSLLVTLIMGWFFVGQVLRPISAIIRKIDTLSPVEQSERLPALAEKDEIAELVETFNGLFDKLEDSFKMQKSFTSNASHELFNPLTKIKSQMEVALIQNRDGAAYRETIQSVLEDLNELIRLMQDLLDFSKMQSNYIITREVMRIDELLFDLRNQLLAQNPGYTIHIQFTNPPQHESQFIIYGSKRLLLSAIKNIVENACKFSDDGTAVLNLIISDSGISLSITDKGPGIAQKEMSNIFEPFYRSQTTMPVKGFGIGLALAQVILKRHGFSLAVQSAQGEGTTFTIGFSN